VQAQSEITLANISNQLKLIIFDLDGTLIDSSKPMRDALNFTVNKFDLPKFGTVEADALIGTPLSKIFMRLLGRSERDDVIEDCIKTYREKYLKICCRYSHLYDGVIELMPMLAEKYSIAMATTKLTDVAAMTLEYFELRGYFDVVYGADKVTNPKPSPEIINKILEDFQVGQADTLMVGDSLYDLKAGKGAGVFTCIVTYGFDNIENLKKNKPDFLIDSFNQLKQLL
jgi:HAD superfamily hydrolase (TIGR01509 family)